MDSYAYIRKVRAEGGIYARTPKVETSVLAESLRISCNALRHEELKERVTYVLTQALYNADDTNVDGYADNRGAASREQFWSMIFRTSIQDVASREGKRVAKFFTSRGVRI